MLKIGIVPKINEQENRYVLSCKLLDKMILNNVLPILILHENQFSECDGFILSGGKDINPIRYHQCQRIETICENEFIEQLEFKLIDYCVKHQIMLLGICRGMQAIHVYFGGTLCQHISSHRAVWHKIIQKDCLLQTSRIFVYSDHHQCLFDQPESLQITATSEDGIIEAIESDTIFGVQWHPEWDEFDDLLPLFFKRVASYKVNKQENR